MPEIMWLDRKRMAKATIRPSFQMMNTMLLLLILLYAGSSFGGGDKEQLAYQTLVDIDRTNRSVVHLEKHVHPQDHSWIRDCYHPDPYDQPSLAWLSQLSACKRKFTALLLQQIAAGYKHGRKLVVYTYEASEDQNALTDKYTPHTASLNSKYCDRWNCTFVSFKAEECSTNAQQRDGTHNHAGDTASGSSGTASSRSSAGCKVRLLHKLLQDHPDAALFLYLDPTAALVDHNIDIRLLPEMFPGASMYVSLDWLPAEPQHANTGVMLFANTPQLPGLITTWQLAIDAAAAATWQQGDPDYLNHLLHSDDTFQGSVWLLPACHLNDRPKSLVDRTFIAQMGCTGATAATAEASDIAAEALMAAEKKEEDEEEALWRAEVQRLQLEGHALPAGMLQQVPRQELRGPRELRAVDMETYYGFWDTRYGEPEADNSGGGKGGGKEASSV